MVKLCKALALLLVCCMLLPVLPAAAETGIVGRWQGAYGAGTLTLLLGGNGAYISTYEDTSTFYKEAGTYLGGSDTLTLRSADDTTITYRLNLTATSLTLQDTNTGGWITMDWQPWGVPEDIIGTWEGETDGKAFYLTLWEDSAYYVLDGAGDLLEEGIFLAYRDNLLMLADDESFFGFSFLAYGSYLDLTTEDGDVIALDWYDGYAPETPSPAPLFTDTPVVTEAPAVTAEPPVTETPLPFALIPGLTGVWKGKDATGELTLTLADTGEISLSYDGDALPARQGDYTADAVSITASYDDGTARAFRYMLMADILLLSDENLQNPVTFNRVPAEQGFDLLLAGIWGGNIEGVYKEFMFAPDGAVSLFVPASGMADTGACNTADGRFTIAWSGSVLSGGYVLDGNTLTLTLETGAFLLSRKAAPLVRLEPAPDTATAATDPLVLGSWSGMDGDLYMELTLRGNGQLIAFVPADEEQSLTGTYMAVNGSLAMMTQTVSRLGTYTVSGDTLTLMPEGQETVILTRMPGQLVRSPAVP